MTDTPIDRLLDSVAWEYVEQPAGPDPDGLPRVTHAGVLRIGRDEIRCYQLEGGRRILDAEDLGRFFGVALGEK